MSERKLLKDLSLDEVIDTFGKQAEGVWRGHDSADHVDGEIMTVTADGWVTQYIYHAGSKRWLAHNLV